jgi:outer membrane protease
MRTILAILFPSGKEVYPPDFSPTSADFCSLFETIHKERAMHRWGRATLTAALLCTAAPAALAEDMNGSVNTLELGSRFGLSGGIGYSFIRGDEIVFDGAGNRISHLIWESQSPTLTLAAKAELGNHWSLRANGAFAFSGNSHMQDYDWFGPFFVSYDFNDWTHRSVHPDTRLHNYFTGDLAIGRDIAVGNAIFNLNGGFKYTSVNWTAYGGSFDYSVFGFRDISGVFPNGMAGISFQQRYPGLFLGVDLEATRGRWSFSGQLRGGVSIGATDTDHHWLRDLRFEERYGAIPFAAAAARLDYAVRDNVSLFLSGNFERYFQTTGDTTVFDIPSGVQLATFQNGAAMALRTITVSAGLKAKF